MFPNILFKTCPTYILLLNPFDILMNNKIFAININTLIRTEFLGKIVTSYILKTASDMSRRCV